MTLLAPLCKLEKKKWKHVIYSKAKVYARKKFGHQFVNEEDGVFLPALSNPSSLTLANCWALVAANSIVKNRTCRPFITVKDQWLKSKIVILKNGYLCRFTLAAVTEKNARERQWARAFCIWAASSPWKHVKEPPRALWIAARAPKFLYHRSIRDK